MKRLLLLAVAVLILSAGSSEAAGNRTRVYRQARTNGGVVSRMIELERRKNAWLRQTFFGR